MIKRQIKFFLIPIFMLLIMADLSSFCFASPKIVFKEQLYHANKVKQGEVVTHIFKFQNTGDETLSIDKVKAG